MSWEREELSWFLDFNAPPTAQGHRRAKKKKEGEKEEGGGGDEEDGLEEEEEEEDKKEAKERRRRRRRRRRYPSRDSFQPLATQLVIASPSPPSLLGCHSLYRDGADTA